jgi:hypothetical protein
MRPVEWLNDWDNLEKLSIRGNWSNRKIRQLGLIGLIWKIKRFLSNLTQWEILANYLPNLGIREISLIWKTRAFRIIREIR